MTSAYEPDDVLLIIRHRDGGGDVSIVSGSTTRAGALAEVRRLVELNRAKFGHRDVGALGSYDIIEVARVVDTSVQAQSDARAAKLTTAITSAVTAYLDEQPAAPLSAFNRGPRSSNSPEYYAEVQDGCDPTDRDIEFGPRGASSTFSVVMNGAFENGAIRR